MFLDFLLFEKVVRYYFILILVVCFNSTFSQVDTSLSLTFDFNEHLIKEVNDKVQVKSSGVTLTNDRFGNEKSAIFIHGNISSYLNLSTSPLVKPKKGTVSIWVNLDRRIYAGKGYEFNPIILTKNALGDDFIIAYALSFDCYSNKLSSCLSNDSLNEALIVAEENFKFNKWYHLAIAFDDDFLAFYIDGKLQQKTKKNFNTKYLASDSVVVGHSASLKNERYSLGSFDDIQIFHRVLNENEINDLYNAPNPNKLKNAIAEIFKYGVIILALILIIIYLLIRNKQNLKKQKEQLEIENKITELELKVVKAQMNPHFISNCLAAIQELIYKNDVDKAGLYIAKFSYFLRQILNYSDKNYITISEEIEIIKLNVELEQLRFKNEFEFCLMVDENIDIDEILIPSLITQTFIENAIWHGLIPLKNKRKPLLKIELLLRNNFPTIIIEDNGVGRDLSNPIKETSKGTKLIMDKIENLNRLSKTTANKIEIIDLLDNEKNQIGTKVIIQLENV